MRTTKPTRQLTRSFLAVVIALLALSLISAAAWAANALTVTKVDALTLDVNGNGKADPGDTIRYTVTIKNTGAVDALNVVLTDIVDANTSLDVKSINISPLAFPDSYDALGNTRLRVGGTPAGALEVYTSGSVLSNDHDFKGDTFSLNTAASDVTSTQGGTVTWGSDGSFTYLPKAGFSGQDTFEYVIQDTGGLTGTGTVTIQVGTRVWYVNDDAPAGGDGRSISPFQTLSSAQSASLSSDVIYAFAGNYTSGIALKNNQKLIGEGVPLQVGGVALNAAGTRPTLSNPSGTVITLADANTVSGLNLTAAAYAAVSGSPASGPTLIDNTKITLTGSAKGVNFASLKGDFTFNGAAGDGITGATGTALAINSGDATTKVMINNLPIQMTGGRAVDINYVTGGRITFDANSPMTTTSGTQSSVYLSNNTNTALLFNGRLDLTTTSNVTAFYAHTNGTVSVANSASTISAFAQAIDLADTMIGATGMTFTKINAGNAGSSSNYGISMTNVSGSGTFAITGTGSAGSGGLIQNIRSSGVLLANAPGVSLSLNGITLTNANLNSSGCTSESVIGSCFAAITLNNVKDAALNTIKINGTTHNGIWAQSLNGFTLASGDIQNVGTAEHEDGIELREVTGTVSITNTQIKNVYDRSVLVHNQGTSAKLNFTFTGNTLDGTTYGDGLTLTYMPGVPGSVDATVTNNTFQNLAGDGYQANNEGSLSSLMQTWVNTNTIQNVYQGVNLTGGGSAGLKFNVSNNPTIHTRYAGVNLFGQGNLVMEGRINGNNSITALETGSPIPAGVGIVAGMIEQSRLTAEIKNNTISAFDDTGIIITSGSGSGTPNTNTQLTLQGNTITQPSGSATAYQGVFLRAGSSSTGDTSQLCADMKNNTITGNQPGGFTAFVLQWSSPATSKMTIAGTSGSSGTVSSYLTANNPGSNVILSNQTYPAGTCASPSFTALPPSGPAMAEKPQPPQTQAAAAQAAVPMAQTTGGKAQALLLPLHDQLAAVGRAVWKSVTAPFTAPASVNEPLGTLPTGQTVTVTYTVQVNNTISAGVKSIANQASVSSDQGTNLSDDPDTQLVPNDATLTTLNANPDLSLDKSHTGSEIRPGELLTFTLSYANTGNQDASGVTLTETVPANTTFNAAGSTAGWSCVPDNQPESTCTLNTATLPVGGSGSATFALRVANTIPAGVASISNTASIADDHSGGVDPASNNTDNDQVTLNAAPDLALIKDDQGADFMPGEVIIYDLTYSNIGNQGATGVSLTDTLPADTQFSSSDSDTGWSCTPVNSKTVCTFAVGSVPAGGSGVVKFAVKVDETAISVVQIDNTAAVADDGANGTEPDSSNNLASASTPIRNRPPVLSNVSLTASVNEGGEATLSGTIFDPDAADTFTLTVDWGDASTPEAFTYPAGTTSFSETHTYVDDNPTGTPSDSNTVKVSLKDSYGNSAAPVAAQNIAVNNVSPALLNLTVSPTAIDENAQATLSGTISDPGSQDSFRLVVDWGDASAPETFAYTAGTVSFSEKHTYLNDRYNGVANPPYAISLTLTDDDSGATSASASAQVNNTAPVFGMLAATDTVEGGQSTLTGTFSDAGSLDVFTLTVDWGDGSAPQLFNYAAGTTSFSENHTYVDNKAGGYTIQASLSDGQDTALKSTTANVSNAAPIITNLAATAATENSQTTLTGAISDAGSQDSFTLTVDWGDGSTLETFTAPAGATSFSRTHLYLDDNPTGTPQDNLPIAVQVSDKDGGAATGSTAVTISNVAPQLQNVQVSPASVHEGNPTTLTGEILDPGTQDVFTLLIDWGDGTTPVSLPYAKGSTSFSAPHTYLTKGATGSYSIDVTLADDDTGSDTTRLPMTVISVPPQLSNISLTPEINENGTVTLAGDVISQNPLGLYALTIDWGEGAPQVVNLAVGATTFSLDHQYLDDNPTLTSEDTYAVTLTISDQEGGSSSTTQETKVKNVAPLLSQVATTSAVVENGKATLTGKISDPGTLDTFTLTVNWGDGSAPETFTEPAGAASFSYDHIYRDDQPTATNSDVETVTIQIADDDGGQVSASTSITVDNADPVLTNLVVTSPVNEGSPATLSGTISDPGSQDTFTLTVDWGDGSTPENFAYAAGTTSFSEDHTYADNRSAGAYDIQVVLKDDDTGQATSTTQAMVNNVAPQINALTVTTPLDEGDQATLTGDILDPGKNDSFALTIDWGDGSTPETYSLAAGDTSFTERHIYLDDNPTATSQDIYPITIAVQDKDGGQGSASSNVTIRNVVPTVSAGQDITVYRGAAASFSGSISDPGIQDTFTYSWDMGDGSPAVTGTLTPEYTYTSDGTYTVILTVTDDDGGVSTDSTQVVVTPAADLEISGLVSSTSVLSGTKFSYNFTVTNHGLSTATNVVVTDSLPANLAFVSGSPECSASGQVVTCSLASLAAGESQTLSIVVVVPDQFTGTLANTASVAADEADLAMQNNSVTLSVTAAATIVVSDSDFEDGVEPTWQACKSSHAVTPHGSRGFLGELGNETACLKLTNLPEHMQVRVSFDLYVIRSWDGNMQIYNPATGAPLLKDYTVGGKVGPDRWFMRADNQSLVDTTFTNMNMAGFMQSYPDSYPNGSHPAYTGAEEYQTLGYDQADSANLDSVYHITRVFDHNATTLDLEFLASGLQSIDDESWGLDNVTVQVYNTSTWNHIYLPLVTR